MKCEKVGGKAAANSQLKPFLRSLHRSLPRLFKNYAGSASIAVSGARSRLWSFHTTQMLRVYFDFFPTTKLGASPTPPRIPHSLIHSQVSQMMLQVKDLSPTQISKSQISNVPNL